MSSTQARHLTTADVIITVTAQQEDETPLGSYVTPGHTKETDPEAKKFARAVARMVDKHGLWGWCTVKVTAWLGPLEGAAYLGCCSYKSADDFKRGGYYEQKVEEALKELQDQVDELYPLICAEDS